MREFSIGDQNTADEVVGILQRGGVALIPTDTAYALCVDATNAQAVEKVFEIKDREVNKKLPVFFDSIDSMAQEIVFSKEVETLAKSFWPGALTIVAPITGTDVSKWSPDVVDNYAIGIRIPDSEFIRYIVRKLGRPITSTSANKSGGETCYGVNEVKESLGENFGLIDAVVDGGELPRRPTSTVVKIIGEDVEILREGAISREEINRVLEYKVVSRELY